ncbi:MAG: trypsin-like peptidase domain-containing protein [Bacteroidales bacterium]|nr:trypsin-like peptidase domain-containing protein [Bacteroidales bacterium]
MKIKNYCFVLLLCVSFAAMSQRTDYPAYDKVKGIFYERDAKIYTIVSGIDYTLVYLYKYPLKLNTEIYIEYLNPVNKETEKIKIINSDVTIRGEGFSKCDVFKLTFPTLPEGVNVINLIEPNGVRYYGVHIFPVNYKTLIGETTHRVATSDKDLKKLVDSSTATISGYYEMLTEDGCKIAVVQSKDSIFAVYAGQDKGDSGSWKIGEVKALLRPMAISNAYKALWFTKDKTKETAIITFDAISMTVSFNNDNTNVYVKMGDPRTISKDVENTIEFWTGSGFALGNGYIVTNNHVVGTAKKIIIKGVDGDLNTSYSAVVVAMDKVNDISVIRINDPNFKDYGEVPYAVLQRMANVGEDIFVLGYSLTQALGNEIKLTNGIVSSRTGYKGDISAYQISAPIQPGNSGGPLFDNDGNVIGIVVAGVPGTENVGYAIKTSYLKILIESAGLNIKFPTNNSISTLSLAEKVKRVKNYVFYIECNK